MGVDPVDMDLVGVGPVGLDPVGVDPAPSTAGRGRTPCVGGSVVGA